MKRDRGVGKELALFRDQAEAFRSVLDSTHATREALKPFAHLLRALIDCRSLSERVEDAVRQQIPTNLFPLHGDPSIVRGVLRRLADVHAALPLAAIPDARTVSAAMRRLDAKNRAQFGGEMSHSTAATSYCTTISTTRGEA